jgi:hypothetical protein
MLKPGVSRSVTATLTYSNFDTDLKYRIAITIDGKVTHRDLIMPRLPTDSLHPVGGQEATLHVHISPFSRLGCLSRSYFLLRRADSCTRQNGHGRASQFSPLELANYLLIVPRMLSNCTGVQIHL